MSLVKYNNNSISSLTTAGQLASGSLVPISEQTASGSASIEFTTGIDSTYPIYKFEFINIHPATDNVDLLFQSSTNTGSSYGVTMTNTFFSSWHNEADNSYALHYGSGEDAAQSTSFHMVVDNLGSDNDQATSGEFYLFNPSSTTFVKHFMGKFNNYTYNDFSRNDFVAGYFNTTSAVDAMQFKMSSGNIDSGTIKLYGIKDS